MDTDVSPGRAFILNAIDTGSRARAFLESELGRRLIERAETQRVAALEELVTIIATDTSAVVIAQLRVRTIDLALRWFAEMIEEAEAALGEMETQHDDYQDRIG